ncbi:MAG: hypothetical protein ACYDCL_20125 [Myxococcales bacterium]
MRWSWTGVATAIASIVLVAVSMWAWLIMPMLIFSYDLTPSEVRILALKRFTVHRIRLSSILDVRTCSLSDSDAFWMSPLIIKRLVNRHFPGPGVLIKVQGASTRRILISPKEPEKFVERVRAAVATDDSGRSL